MSYVTFESTKLYYDREGPSGGPLIFLIEGLGAQATMWPEGFCAGLTSKGFQIVRYDHRDVGLSSTSDREYGLDTLCQDAHHLICHLGMPKVHVVGQSMGGMVAQLLSTSFPDCVASLTSIYSAPSRRFLIQDEAVRGKRDQGPAGSYEEAVDQFIEREHVSGFDGWTNQEIRRFAESVIGRDYEREACHHGRRLHMRAVENAPDRTESLGGVNVPVAVIHGREDPLVSFEGGIATARAVPGAELYIYSGMRHQLRPDLWTDYVGVVERTVGRASL